MKKLLVTLICLLLVLCSFSTASAFAPVAASDLKLGFIYIGDVTDMGYTYAHHQGTLAMQRAFDLRDDQILIKRNISEDSACETAIRELIEQGCHAIFATSFGFMDYMAEMAEEYPDVIFLHCSGYKSNDTNFANYFGRIYEARYLSGIAAGLKTEANKLGYVAAHPFAEVISGYSAFYLGAKSVNPDVEMLVMYTNDWNDPTREAQVAKALIDQGCDVLGQHCDSTAPATTAEAAGMFQVGYNSDMIPAAPNASLTSARIDWSKYLIYAVGSYLSGEQIAVDWSQGLAENAVYLSPLNDAIIAEGTAEAIDAAHTAIVSGGFKVFAGPLYDASGALIVEEGSHFPEQETESAPSFDRILQGIAVIEG